MAIQHTRTEYFLLGNNEFVLTALILAVFVQKASAQNCTGVVCNNGGVCNSFTASPPCICPLPYIPPYCSSGANYCNTLQPEKNITSLPVCLNDGNCTMSYTDPYFNCTCLSGYNGIRCQMNATDTTISPSTISLTPTVSQSTSAATRVSTSAAVTFTIDAANTTNSTSLAPTFNQTTSTATSVLTPSIKANTDDGASTRAFTLSVAIGVSAGAVAFAIIIGGSVYCLRRKERLP